MAANAASQRRTVLTVENMNPHVRAMEYAVRGAIVIRAGDIEKELKSGVKKPFTNVVRCNIGDSHAMGQKPITFIRQVLACCHDPTLIPSGKYPADVVARAQKLLAGCKGSSIGAYSDSLGIETIRKDIAAYISDRDGYPSDWQNCFTSTGASDGIKSILKLMMTGESGDKKAGVMIPIPQYPLYSATNAEYNAYQINYYMNEDKNWGLDMEELERAIGEARGKCMPRAIVVINPGNPTGQVLTKEDIQDVIKFAKKEHLFILADEVYQHNIYAAGSAFHSFKKVMTEMGPEYAEMELASFFSTSKGYMGECGFRGGYCEAVNLDPGVKAQLYKSLSAKLCPTISGQCALDCVVNHPKQGEPSYELWNKEKSFVLSELKRKARLVTDGFNKIEGVTCNEVQGAMYSFPKISMPPKLIEEAKAKGQKADVFYCFNLLEETGICVVPGSGFGQKEGTFHFRMTILPPTEVIEDVVKRFTTFHEKFMAKYK